jgi:hypothetical protein
MPSLWAIFGLLVLAGLGVCAASWYSVIPPLAAFVGAGMIAVYPAFSIGIRGGYHGWAIGLAAWLIISLILGAVVFFHFTPFS